MGSNTGTPIIASGNGIIEEAGRKGHYGNYVRIPMPTAIRRPTVTCRGSAQGAATGVKVRQGQIIGFVSVPRPVVWPALHFEVLINNQFVDPMSIRVPRERQLEGKNSRTSRRNAPALTTSCAVHP